MVTRRIIFHVFVTWLVTWIFKVDFHKGEIKNWLENYNEDGEDEENDSPFFPTSQAMRSPTLTLTATMMNMKNMNNIMRYQMENVKRWKWMKKLKGTWVTKWRKSSRKFANVHKIKFWTAGIVLVFIYFYRIFISNDENKHRAK
jgi:hypothetical protein